MIGLQTDAAGATLRCRQDPLLSRAAARYIQMSIPALWCTGGGLLQGSSAGMLLAQPLFVQAACRLLPPHSLQACTKWGSGTSWRRASCAPRRL